MSKSRKIINYLIFIIFIFSKFFYFSLLKIAEFNVTLSDVFLLLMFVNVILSKKKINALYKKIIVASVLIGLTIILGSLLQKTSVVSGLVIYVKRWFSLILIPVYLKKNFEKKDINNLIFMMVLIVLIFGIFSWDSLISSIRYTRLIDTFNPNVLGMVMSIIMVTLINYNDNPIPRIFVYLSILVCFIFIIAVSSRGALFALIPALLISYLFKLKGLTYKIILQTLGVLIIALTLNKWITSFLRNIFSFSYERIFNTIYYGIFNDSSVSARLTTQKIAINLMVNDFKLLLFGTGFGNFNMYLSLLKRGYEIQTADNMFVNLFVWSGFIGFIIFSYIILSLIKRIYSARNNPFRHTMLILTLYVLLAGISQETLTEPTIGAFYMIMLGIYELFDDRGSKKNENTICV